MPNADADFLKQLQGLFVQFFHFGVAERAQDQLAHGILFTFGGILRGTFGAASIRGRRPTYSSLLATRIGQRGIWYTM